MANNTKYIHTTQTPTRIVIWIAQIEALNAACQNDRYSSWLLIIHSRESRWRWWQSQWSIVMPMPFWMPNAQKAYRILLSSWPTDPTNDFRCPSTISRKLYGCTSCWNALPFRWCKKCTKVVFNVNLSTYKK